jgi:hypothetical protein
MYTDKTVAYFMYFVFPAGPKVRAKIIGPFMWKK